MKNPSDKSKLKLQNPSDFLIPPYLKDFLQPAEDAADQLEKYETIQKRLASFGIGPAGEVLRAGLPDAARSACETATYNPDNQSITLTPSIFDRDQLTTALSSINRYTIGVLDKKESDGHQPNGEFEPVKHHSGIMAKFIGESHHGFKKGGIYSVDRTVGVNIVGLVVKDSSRPIYVDRTEVVLMEI